MKICLSLDGGGCRGVIEVAALQWLAEKYSITHHDIALVVGTSTGAIVGTLYRSGVHPSKMVRMYEDITRVFVPRWRSLFGLLGPKYKLKPVEELFRTWKYRGILKWDKFTDYPMLMISSYNLSIKREIFFKSWSCERKGSNFVPVLRMNRFTIKDVLRAATAIPTYFKPMKLSGQYFCDGGVVANCPLLAAYTEMRKLFPNEKIVIISLGTGAVSTARKEPKYEKFGILKWINPLLNIFVNNSYDVYITDKIAQIVDDKCAVVRIDPPIPANMAKSILTMDEVDDLFAMAKRYVRCTPYINQQLDVLLR
ncbi:MAG: patatin-like phospholipase family protein [Crenarchaeota archaeon]|nr:patatin-like phospholipase family protein [Thermoproteota archaeon]